MPDMHDDAVDKIMHQLRARAFTTSAVVDGQQLPATHRWYVETAERLGPVLDVQAVLGATEDGAHLVYVGQEVFTPSSLAALHRHLGELLDVLPGSHGAGPDGAGSPAEDNDIAVTADAPGSLVVSGRVPGESATVNLRVDVTGDAAAHVAGGEADRWSFAPIAARRLARALREAAVASRHLLAG